MRIINAMFGCKLGGIEQCLIDYTKALLTQNHSVGIIVHPKAKIIEALKKVHDKKINLFKISNLGAWDPFAVWKLKKCLKAYKPDLIIAHGNRAMSLLTKAARKEKIPVIGVAHNYKLQHIVDCDAAFTITTDLLNKLSSLGFEKERIYNIPNMIDIPFEQKEYQERKFHTPPVIGALGRFVKKKGFDDFICAVAKLKEKGLSFKAVLSGLGEEDAALKQLAKEKGLEDVLTFSGWCNDPAQFYQSIDIFCVPSKHEPFGIVLLEGFLYNLPVVSTATEGPIEIVQDGKNGLLVPIGDFEKMADVLAFVLNNPEKAKVIAREGKKTIIEKYSIDVSSKRIDEALKKIKKQGKRG